MPSRTPVRAAGQEPPGARARRGPRHPHRRPRRTATAAALNRALLRSLPRRLPPGRGPSTRLRCRARPERRAAHPRHVRRRHAEELELPEGTEAAACSTPWRAALDDLNAVSRSAKARRSPRKCPGTTKPLRAGAAAMEEIRARALPIFQDRLHRAPPRAAQRRRAIEPQRLAQEAAILADRSDIGEELARLKIHAAQLGETARRRRRESARSSISCCRR